MESQRLKTIEAKKNKNCGFYFEEKCSAFNNIPGVPIAYWVSERFKKAFVEFPMLKDYSCPKAGLSTTDNDRFLRLWHEVDIGNICEVFADREELKKLSAIKKWFKMTKGGAFRKWFGNNEYVLNFYNDGEELKYWLVNNPKDPTTKSYSKRSIVSMSVVR